MSSEPVIAPSAYRHGVEDKDMLHAFNQPVRVIDEGDGFVMFIGPNHTGSALLEVGVVEATHGGLVIVHAMPARMKYLRATKR